MQSILFSRFDLTDERNKTFSNDLDIVLELVPDQLDLVIGNLPDFYAASSNTKRKAIVNSLSQATQIVHYKIETVLGVLGFFLGQMEDKELQADTPESWNMDLVNLGVVTEEKSPFFLKLLNGLKQIGPQIFAIRRVQMETGGVFSRYSSISYTVEIRGVFDTDYETLTPIEKYSPVLLDVIPIASINIGLSGEGKTEITFQATAEQIGSIIAHLEAVKKLISEMHNKVKLQE